ncbi:MAG: hypothetical protein IIZ57_07865 [Solobacterium sp.]|nr:hypothetical protein [Solobacterium sp.]
MSDKQKSLRTLSMIEIIFGLIYAVEGLIVASGKIPYFIAGAITAITGLYCYMSATDPSKAKSASFLLWVAIILDFASCVLGFINKAGGVNIGTSVVDICIAAYLLKLIKDING